ncbi:MAG: phage terminase large subunit family protein [Bacteroidales bacterium]|nr:phage terminase large subunit family protein [Bacteroidales bacterium]
MRRPARTFRVPASVIDVMPERLAASISRGQEIDFVPSPAERKVIRKPAMIPVSEWAAKHRMLIKSALPGAWKNETTPYLTGIMDASVVPCVETVIICKVPQSGGTEIEHNFSGRSIDVDPGDILYVFPDDKTARENAKDRILPMIKSSLRLRSYRTGRDEDEASTRINLQHMTIYTASAQSASQLANKPCRYVLFDEVDKYPDTAGKREADPISLGRARATTYGYGRKIWMLSSPTIEQGPIWQAYQHEAQIRFVYLVRCPLCGEMQCMTTKQVRWTGGSEADAEVVESTGAAWYECAKCAGTWTDHLRNKAVSDGYWVAEDSGVELFASLKARRPRKIGFHLPGLISRFVTLAEYAAAFLKAMHDKTKMKDFRNRFEALPWVDYQVSREEDAILALCDDRPEMLVPDDADILLAAMDTQDNGFWYEIRAFKLGPELESWGIREGFVDSFTGLDKILFNDVYEKMNGQALPVYSGMIDSQGHRTAAVYDWCRLHPQIKPIAGERTIKGSPVPPPTIIDRYPGTKRPIPGGIMLYRLDTNYFKNLLSGKLNISPSDPGAWHMHAGYKKSHARHLTSEYIDDQTGFWTCPGHKDNHLWDCAVYMLAEAERLQLARQTRRPKPAKRKPVGPNPYTGGASMFAGGR